jgi:threonine/homoserine/homoserine lactone efflux protein
MAKITIVGVVLGVFIAAAILVLGVSALWKHFSSSRSGQHGERR